MLDPVDQRLELSMERLLHINESAIGPKYSDFAISRHMFIVLLVHY